MTDLLTLGLAASNASGKAAKAKRLIAQLEDIKVMQAMLKVENKRSIPNYVITPARLRFGQSSNYGKKYEYDYTIPVDNKYIMERLRQEYMDKKRELFVTCNINFEDTQK